MAELKPCPFCGKTSSVQWDSYNGIHYILCNIKNGGCGSTSGGYENKSETLELWNTRTNDAARQEGLEKQKKDIEYFNMCISGARERLAKNEIMKADLLLHSAQMHAEAIRNRGDHATEAFNLPDCFYWQICYTDSTYCDNADKIRYTKHGVWYIDTEGDGKYWQFVPWRRVHSMITWRA